MSGRQSCWCLFCQLNTMGRGNLKWGITSIGLAYEHVCGAFSWFLIDVGRPSPLWVVLSLGRWALKAWKWTTLPRMLHIGCVEHMWGGRTGKVIGLFFQIPWHVKIIVFYNCDIWGKFRNYATDESKFFLCLFILRFSLVTLSLDCHQKNCLTLSSGHTSRPTFYGSLRDSSRARHCLCA